MSALTFIASSRPLYIPDDLPQLYVHEVEPLEYVSLKRGRFTMPTCTRSKVPISGSS